jgi:hypothetical protein
MQPAISMAQDGRAAISSPARCARCRDTIRTSPGAACHERGAASPPPRLRVGTGPRLVPFSATQTAHDSQRVVIYACYTWCRPMTRFIAPHESRLDSFPQPEKAMRIIDSEPAGWFLVEDGADLLLDVNCNHSAFGYSVLIKLSSQEVAEYRTAGRSLISQLADRVQSSGPGGECQSRDVSAAYGDVVMQARRTSAGDRKNL